LEQLTLEIDAPAIVKAAHTVESVAYPIWTENKARLVQLYLKYFVYVTKHGTYIDGFAGPQQHGLHNTWTAKLVLENEPNWFQYFYLYDIGAKQIQELEILKREHLVKSVFKRDIRVTEGDFNCLIDNIVRLQTIKARQATFCLLDQRTFECHWSTVEKLARYKKRGNKIELFYFVPVGWLGRSLAAQKNPDEKMRSWWGREDWRILEKKSHVEIAEIFQVRFQELGYEYVFPWPIYNRKSGGGTMYYMVHATDHPDAPDLMRRAYKAAVRAEVEPPIQPSLFDD
jgi:three-Cys-motif partner protein